MEEEEFRGKFVIEANEIIQALEEALLKLEKRPDDTAQTNEIFRHMHSLKGSGAMFGFHDLSSFTHHLENLFDIVRKNPTCLNKGIFDVTFLSVDHIKNLLAEKLSEPVKQHGKELIDNVQDIINVIDPEFLKKRKIVLPRIEIRGREDEIPEKTDIATYYIYFKPEEYILIDGTNPLYLIDELINLGHGFVITHTNNLPGFKQLKPKMCYTFWELILVSKESKDEMRDAFLFVEDTSVIEIKEISNTDLLADPKIMAYLETQLDQSQEIDIEYLQSGISDQPDELPPVEVQDVEASVVAEPEPHTPEAPGDPAKIISTIRVPSEKLDTLMNLVSEFVTAQARLDLYTQNRDDPALMNISETFHKLSRQLRENTFDICLIPIHNLVTKFSRLVRDLSKETGKPVELITRGTDTELDKTIVEQLNDPLLHIIRNCIDHGIEPTEERLKKGKPETGQILFHSYYSGTYVYIIVKDDGKGLDLEGIRKKAVEKELIGPEEKPDRKRLFDMILMPGFSTSTQVTSISGRGVGMDVVKQKIEELRGEVEIESVKDEGTSVIIKIPLTLSIIDGFLLTVGDTAYILPLNSVDKIHELEPGQTEDTYNNVITLDGEQFPFLDLRKEFDIGAKKDAMGYIINIRHEGRTIGLVVDQIIGNYQAVLKPIGKYLKNQDIFSGATILGDGSVALVLDTNRIINKYANEQEVPE